MAVLVLREGRAREFGGIQDRRGELNPDWCLGFLLCDDSEGVASGEVLLGDSSYEGGFGLGQTGGAVLASISARNWRPN